jgi:hypothetical protein
LDAKFSFAFNFFAILVEMFAACNLEGSSTRNHSFISIDILDRPETISGCFLDHGDGVLVGAFNEDGAALGVLDTFDKGELLFS